MPALLTWGPRLGPPEPPQNPGAVRRGCNPGLGGRDKQIKGCPKVNMAVSMENLLEGTVFVVSSVGPKN